MLNPTAVFCNDRDRYYAMRAEADSGTTAGLEAWCIYVLQGILDELRKVDRLTDFAYLAEKILSPAIAHARERGRITATEARVLQAGAHKGIAQKNTNFSSKFQPYRQGAPEFPDAKGRDPQAADRGPAMGRGG